MRLINNLNGFYFKVVEFPNNWANIKADWLTLFNECLQPCVFYHPIFMDAAYAIKDCSPTHLALGYKDDKLCLGLPIIIEKYFGPFKKMGNFLGISFDHLAPLDNSFNYKATRNFFHSIRNTNNCLFFIGNNLENNFTSTLRITSRNEGGYIYTRPRLRSPHLCLPKDPEQLTYRLNKKFSQNLRYSLKQAEKVGIQFRIITSDVANYSFGDAFNNLIRLHADRSECLNRTSGFLTRSQYFYKKLCEKGESVKDIIWFTEAIYQDQVIGSLFGFSTPNRFYFLQHGFYSHFSKYSIGNLLIYHTMAELIKRKIFIFDFLRGVEAYKLKWTQNIDEDYYMIYGTSMIGRMALEFIRLKKSLNQYGFKGIHYRMLNKDLIDNL
jgi:hypothetical protein